MFREGDFLRHRSKPEWGHGQGGISLGDEIQIRFPHAPVTLKLDIAGAMLEAAEAPG